MNKKMEQVYKFMEASFPIMRTMENDLPLSLAERLEVEKSFIKIGLHLIYGLNLELLNLSGNVFALLPMQHVEYSGGHDFFFRMFNGAILKTRSYQSISRRKDIIVRESMPDINEFAIYYKNYVALRWYRDGSSGREVMYDLIERDDIHNIDMFKYKYQKEFENVDIEHEIETIKRCYNLMIENDRERRTSICPHCGKSVILLMPSLLVTPCNYCNKLFVVAESTAALGIDPPLGRLCSITPKKTRWNNIEIEGEK